MSPIASHTSDLASLIGNLPHNLAHNLAGRVVERVSVHPDPTRLPGGHQIQQILDGLGGWALFAALGGLLVSVIVWSLGSFGGNYHAVSRGKTGVLVCGAAALIAGGAAPIINFFANLGSQIHG